ncbi:MAG: hypothetical protein M1812_002959 [Candelaria pacifica]|nr:MAG: hypothetical protein M1812_002959 [Candelaria pacifica]
MSSTNKGAGANVPKANESAKSTPHDETVELFESPVSSSFSVSPPKPHTYCFPQPSPTTSQQPLVSSAPSSSDIDTDDEEWSDMSASELEGESFPDHPDPRKVNAIDALLQKLRTSSRRCIIDWERLTPDTDGLPIKFIDADIQETNARARGVTADKERSNAKFRSYPINCVDDYLDEMHQNLGIHVVDCERSIADTLLADTSPADLRNSVDDYLDKLHTSIEQSILHCENMIASILMSETSSNLTKAIDAHVKDFNIKTPDMKSKGESYKEQAHFYSGIPEDFDEYVKKLQIDSDFIIPVNQYAKKLDDEYVKKLRARSDSEKKQEDEFDKNVKKLQAVKNIDEKSRQATEFLEMLSEKFDENTLEAIKYLEDIYGESLTGSKIRPLARRWSNSDLSSSDDEFWTPDVSDSESDPNWKGKECEL